MIHMEYYLIVSAIMFFAGIYGFFTRRNTLAILISIELILNATDINFAVFNRFLFPGGLEGYFFSLFSIAISAAETAVAIAIMINIYRNIRSIQVNKLDVTPHCRPYRNCGTGCGRSAFLSHRRNVLQRSPPCRWYVRGADAL